eukprot:3459478-Pyramimonas_sp.AAC.1
MGGGWSQVVLVESPLKGGVLNSVAVGLHRGEQCTGLVPGDVVGNPPQDLRRVTWSGASEADRQKPVSILRCCKTSSTVHLQHFRKVPSVAFMYQDNVLSQTSWSKKRALAQLS